MILPSKVIIGAVIFCCLILGGMLSCYATTRYAEADEDESSLRRSSSSQCLYVLASRGRTTSLPSLLPTNYERVGHLAATAADLDDKQEIKRERGRRRAASLPLVLPSFIEQSHPSLVDAETHWKEGDFREENIRHPSRAAGREPFFMNRRYYLTHRTTPHQEEVVPPTATTAVVVASKQTSYTVKDAVLLLGGISLALSPFGWGPTAVATLTTYGSALAIGSTEVVAGFLIKSGLPLGSTPEDSAHPKQE